MANGNISQLKAYDTNKVLKTYDITDSKARSDITDLQNNKVTGPNSSTANHLAVFKDSTGKEIIDGGVITAGEGISVSGNNIINSGVRSITTGDNNGTIKVNTNGTLNEVQVKGLGSSAYTETTQFINSKNDYINTHQENNPVIIPFINNDIAWLLKRGGSATISYGGVVKDKDLTSLFNGFPNYLYLGATSEELPDEVVIELTLHKSFGWSSKFYIDFGSYNFRAKYIKVEVLNTNFSNDVWTTKKEVSNHSSGNLFFNLSHQPVGASDSVDGFNKLKITLNTWNIQRDRRIAQIGLLSFDSYSLYETFISTGGANNIYGNLVPFDNNKIDLGSLSKYFKNLYINNINGVNLGNNPEFTDNKVTNTLDNNTKNYLTGTTSDTTNTDEQVFDSGIYSTETPGQLNATTYKINEKAILQYNSDNDCIDFTFI